MSRPVPTTIPPGPIQLTLDDYLALPNDGRRYQILDGDLDVTPAPTTRHQRISKRLQFLLMTALERPGLGEVLGAPTDVVLSDHDIVQPDLLFVRRERLGIIGPDRIEGAPDLLVEIVSPSSRRVDVVVKARLYARCGVPSYWIVDPDLERIDLYRLEGGAYRQAGGGARPEVLRPQEFPGLELPLDELFG